MKKFYPLVFIALTFLSVLPDKAVSEELDIVNRPVNTLGLTGLIITSSPFTLSTGGVEIGGASMTETSTLPDYTITEYPVSITVGIARNMEIALRGSYLYREKGTNTARERGAGDTELSYKWNFSPQAEYSVVPAVALLVTGIAQTGDKDKGLNRVHNWGGRIGVAAGTEISWEDHILGIYADIQVAVQDLSQNAYRDRYNLFNAGFLLPISKERNLQILLEYNVVNGKDSVNVDGGDYSTLTYGLRMVSERFNLTIGTQFLHKKYEGYDDSGRVIGMLSAKF